LRGLRSARKSGWKVKFCEKIIHFFSPEGDLASNPSLRVMGNERASVKDKRKTAKVIEFID